MSDELSKCEACERPALNLIEDRLLMAPLCPKCAKLLSSKLRRMAEVFVPPVTRGTQSQRQASALMRYQKYHKTSDRIAGVSGNGSRYLEYLKQIEREAPDLLDALRDGSLQVRGAMAEVQRRELVATVNTFAALTEDMP